MKAKRALYSPVKTSSLAALLTTLAVFSGPLAAGAESGGGGCHTCLKTASGLFSKGDNAGAAKILNEWQPKCPDNLQLLLMLNTVLMRTPTGKAAALEAAEKACTLAPNAMLPHFQKAMTLMMLQRGAEAAKEFRRVVEIEPTSYEAWSALGELLGAEGDGAGARQASEKALQLSPTARQTLLNSINSKNRLGNIGGVRQEIARTYESPGVAPETLLIVGEEAFKLGYFEESARCLQAAQAKYPNAGPVKNILPLASLFSTNLGGTAHGASGGGHSNKDSKVDSGDARSLLDAGMLAQSQGHYKEAIEKYSDAYAKNKNFTIARLFTAKTNLEMSDWKEAISQAKELANLASGLKLSALAIELVARLHDGEDNGNNINALKNELNTARSKYAPAMQADADWALGEAMLQTRDKNAATSFNAALKNRPDFPEALIGLAHSNLQNGDSSGALKNLDRVLITNPGNIQALGLKACALAMSGDAAGADKALGEIHEGELPAGVYLELGKAFQKNQQNKQAAENFRKSMQAGLTGALLQEAKDGLKASGQ